MKFSILAATTLNFLLYLDGVCQAGLNVKTIYRDYVIIGGGSTGTYSAIYLKDKGKSFAVIEPRHEIGGHTESYRDPVTNASIPIGVVVFEVNPVSTAYFQRLNTTVIPIPLSLTTSTSPRALVDFETGQPTTSYFPATQEGIDGFVQQFSKYPYLEKGFDLPDPIPKDLLLPFREFVNKYNISGSVGPAFLIGQGLGDILKVPTLYVLKNSGTSLRDSINPGFYAVISGDDYDLYRRASQVLGTDVYLNTDVESIKRTNSGVSVLVKTVEGHLKINAKKIINTSPPVPSNLKVWDLTKKEKRIFSKFQYQLYYTGIIRHNDSSLETTSLVNVNPNLPFNLPNRPGLYGISATGVPNLANIKYGISPPFTEDEIKKDIENTLKILNITDGKLEYLSNHSPFELTVPVEEIEKGFYRELQGLQGFKNTFYTGAAFHTHSSVPLWVFTKSLLDSVVV